MYAKVQQDIDESNSTMREGPIRTCQKRPNKLRIWLREYRTFNQAERIYLKNKIIEIKF
jgi:hypothetical protein